MRKLLLACAALAMAARGAQACDICAVYTAMEAKEAKPGPFAGLFEQGSDFGTLQEGGHEIDNDARQSLRSSITQVFVGYRWSRRFAVQVNVPYIDRSFRRAAADGVERGTVSGVGDVAVVGHLRLYERLSETTLVTWGVTAGVELPTGDSDRLGEEAEEDHHEAVAPAIARAAAPSVVARPEPHGDHRPASGVHGHDLALGSGSVDGLLGTAFAWRHRRWFGAAAVQYALRREGGFDYRHASETTWEAQTGGYVLLRHENSVSLALRLAGEKKGEDHAGGERADDTAIDALYAGPQVAVSRGRSLYADLAVELPLRQENSGVQVVPDSRVRLGVTWRF